MQNHDRQTQQDRESHAPQYRMLRDLLRNGLVLSCSSPLPTFPFQIRQTIQGLKATVEQLQDQILVLEAQLASAEKGGPLARTADDQHEPANEPVPLSSC
jgi:hypothetical protein